MIEINKKNNEITIKGHSGYADLGSDIVCAGVSSVMFTTVNAILKYNKSLIDYKDDGKSVKIKYQDEKIVNMLIDNMLNNLADIEKSYPKNVKILKEE